jgi:DNA-directed RNA polymerase I, II, and III subunit RPABC2
MSQDDFDEYKEDFDEEDDEEEEEEEEIEDDDGTVGEQLEVDDEETIPINEYKTKFSNELRSEYIKKYHPEEIHKPFDEIYQLSHVTRNEEGNIIDDNHKTYPILSKYEKTRIIGLRVSQLNKGAKPFITLKNKILDNSLIAEKELQDKALPFIIMRPIPNALSEYWKVSDLELI